MGMTNSGRLHERARQVRQRALVRAWDYRQRNLSGGVWFRLRRVLANAREALVIDEEDAHRLIARNHSPLEVGRHLHPEKLIFELSEAEAAQLASAKSIPLRLGPELLTARYLVLHPFDASPRSDRLHQSQRRDAGPSPGVG